MNKIRTGVHKFFQDFISALLRVWPIVLIEVVVLSVVLGVGLMYLDTEGDVEKAVEASRGRLIEDRDHMYDNFPNLPAVELIFMVSRGDNILTLDSYREILAFEAALKVEVEADNMKYEDLCFTPLPDLPCIVPGHPLEFWQVAPGVYDLSSVPNDEVLLAQINSGVSLAGIQVIYQFEFGKADPEDFMNQDGSNSLKKAKAVFYSYQMTGKNSLDDTMEDFEADLEDFCDDFNDNSDYIKAYTLTNTALRRIGDKNVGDNLAGTMVVGTPIVFFLLVVLHLRCSPYRSHANIALGTFLLVACSYFEGMGLTAWAGAKNTKTSAITAPFLSMMFLSTHSFFITSAFGRTQGSAKERVVQTYQAIGLPLLSCLMILTLAYSFLSIANLNRLQDICRDLAVISAFAIINYFTLMPVILFLEAKRQEAKVGDIFCVCCSSQDSEQSPKCRHFLLKVFAFVTKWPVMLGTFIVLLCVGGVTLYFASLVEFKSLPTWVFLSHDQGYKALAARDDYFEDTGVAVLVTSRNLELSLETQQSDLIQLAKDLRNCEDCEQDWLIKDSVVSWYDFFRSWVEGGLCTVANRTVSLTQTKVVPQPVFMPCLVTWLSSIDGLPFIPLIKFNAEGTDVDASILTVGMEVLELDGFYHVTTGLSDLRDLVESGPGATTVYTPPFLFWEHYLTCVVDFIITYVPTAVAMLLFSLFCLGSPIGAVLTLLLSACPFTASLATVDSDDTMTNHVALFILCVLFATSSDFYLYLLSDLAESKDIASSWSDSVVPILCKALCAVGGAVGMYTTTRISEHAKFVLVYAAVNIVMSLLVLPALYRGRKAAPKPITVRDEGHVEITTLRETI
jgi:hypothetical protein